MSVSVEILKTGYSKIDEKLNVMKANCTCSIIRENDTIIIIDPLTAWDAQFLVNALKEKNLETKDVSYVVGTHGHSDHIGNLNLFTNASHIIGQSISHHDEYQLFSFDENNPYKISDNIEIIATPGHTLSDVSVIVRGTSFGTVAVVWDLFEKEQDIDEPSIWYKVAGSEDPDLQFKNRVKILHLADYIIPGHGPGFAVTKNLILSHKNYNS